MKKLILWMLFITTCLSASIDKPRYIRSSGEASVLVRPSPINPDIIGDPKPKDTIKLIKPEDLPVQKNVEDKTKNNENKNSEILEPVRVPAEVAYGGHISKRENVPNNLKIVKQQIPNIPAQNGSTQKVITYTNDAASSSKVTKREIISISTPKKNKRDIPVPVKPSSKAPLVQEDKKKVTESTESTSTTKASESEPHPATFVRPVPVAQLFNKNK